MKSISTLLVTTAITVFAFTLTPATTFAHCRPWHPHHCFVDAGEFFVDAGEFIIGGVEKRARMVFDDPVGALLDPIKVIDDGIPSPLSYVEYTIRNPDEIVEVLKNPVAGVIGMPLALAIADGRNAALRGGVRSIPQDIRDELEPFFSSRVLNSVRYSTGASLFDGLVQRIALHTEASAITLVNVIVFEDQSGSADAALWAHELTHVQQYSELGLSEFAATYTLDYTAIEDPAYRFADYYDRLIMSLNVSYGGRGKQKEINTSRGNPWARMALGDFNGDGKTDIFYRPRNSRDWKVTYSGTGLWKKIGESAAQINQMAFGDFNGDRMTDVFYRPRNSRDWKVSYSGTGRWKTINESAEAIDQMAFGDFNGDGRTDVFYRPPDSRDWLVSYSGTERWEKINESAAEIEEMRFGDFNGDGITDVLLRSFPSLN